MATNSPTRSACPPSARPRRSWPTWRPKRSPSRPGSHVAVPLRSACCPKPRIHAAGSRPGSASSRWSPRRSWKVPRVARGDEPRRRRDDGVGRDLDPVERHHLGLDRGRAWRRRLSGRSAKAPAPVWPAARAAAAGRPGRRVAAARAAPRARGRPARPAASDRPAASSRCPRSAAASRAARTGAAARRSPAARAPALPRRLVGGPTRAPAARRRPAATPAPSAGTRLLGASDTPPRNRKYS